MAGKSTSYSDRSDVACERLLVEAAESGDYDLMHELVEAGVSVDAEEHNRTLFYASKNYMTPLQMASANGHGDCVQFLLDQGADVNAKDRFDVTALHMAAEKGHLLCLKSLLNSGADCSLPTKYSKSGCYTAVPHLGGTTPLHLAAANKHMECVKELIQYGADYNAVDERGRTSLYIAAQMGYKKCVLAHLQNAVGRDILSLPCSETSDTPLHFAVIRGMAECVKALLDSGSDVNHKNYAGLSPLHLAVTSTIDMEGRAMEILKLLVLNGYNTDINQPDGSDHLSPLHYVCFNVRNSVRRRPEMAKFLIAYGANVNIKSRGCSLLQWELKSQNEDFDVLKYIVRSMLHPPHLSQLDITPEGQTARQLELMNMDEPPTPPPRRLGMPPDENLPVMVSFRQLASALSNHNNSAEPNEMSQPTPLHPVRPLPNMVVTLQLDRMAQRMADRQRYRNFYEGHPDDARHQFLQLHPQPYYYYRSYPPRDELNPFSMVEAGYPIPPPEAPIPSPVCMTKKYQWYRKITSSPRTLQHYCRFSIRKSLGSNNLRHLHKLPLPKSMHSYLLLEYDDDDD